MTHRRTSRRSAHREPAAPSSTVAAQHSPQNPSADVKVAPDTSLSESAFRTLIQNAPFGVYRSNVEGRLLLVNPALVDILGYASAEELLSKNLERDIYLNPSVRRRSVGEYWHNKHYWDFEADWKRKDGSIIKVRLTGRAYPATQDHPLYFELFVEDITDRSELERQLLQAQKMEAIGQLAGGIAHDFNNLLGMILGQAELCKEGAAPDDPRLPRIQAIHDAAARAAALTRKLLAFSRKQQADPRRIELNAAVRDVEKLLSEFIGEKIEFSLRLSPDAGYILADPVQLEQVLMNLVVNARDAMPSGGKLTIETSLAEFSETEARRRLGTRPGNFIVLSVIDTGIGMDKLTMSRIFEPFFTTKPPGKGTGLGLSTTYGIVRQCGGFIVPTSEPGHGTTFRIYFPHAEEVAPSASISTPADSSSVAPLVAGETVLLVEDEPGMREITRELLIAAGYKVLEADNFCRALEIAGQDHATIHLLLTDLFMPGMDGRALAAHLCKMIPGLRVLFMSGYSDDLLPDHVAFAESCRVLRKPFSRADLLERVRRALSES
jgi:two-component system, cell cycle sensor histidine kinase and response regulator CckA